MDYKKLISYFKKPQPKKKSSTGNIRSFKAAFNNRFIDWILTSSNKVNIDLISQLKVLIERSRSLAQNNEIFRSYLSNCEKCIVGSEGFRLQMQIKNDDGTLNQELNDEIEWAWYEFTKKKNLELSETLGDIDFDTLLLRTLLVDGEAFIQIIKDPKSPFGVRFKLIDTLSVDTNYIQIMTETQNGIFNGVEVDHNYKPVRYWMRTCYNGNYESGKLYAVPADQIIHLYRQEFIDQVRGFSPIVASLDSLKQLDDFAVAELIAAKVSSCQGIFYQRNGSSVGDFVDQNNADDQGTFLQQLSPGVASIVPKGYNVKTLTPNHPSSQYGEFVKAISKRVAASMGSTYNTVYGDMQSVSYSSLRQANISENGFYKSWQRFLIDNWKNIEFELFLKGYLITNSNSSLKPSQFNQYLRSYRFIPKVDQYYDLSKEAVAIERMLKLGLSSPILECEKRGLDWHEVLEDWNKWNDALKSNGLHFDYGKDSQAPLDVVEQFNEDANNGDDNNK